MEPHSDTASGGADEDPGYELVPRAQAGDTGAFERLYRLHVGRIYALCLRMVADPDRAGILTQDTFVRAWQQLGTFRREAGFGSWLHRIAVNVVLADLRARKRQADAWEPADLEDLGIPDRQVSLDAGMDLERGIAALPAQARAVLVLHDIEGYRHEEIGTMMGIAEGTSKAHLHRARHLLRALLAPLR